MRINRKERRIQKEATTKRAVKRGVVEQYILRCGMKRYEGD